MQWSTIFDYICMHANSVLSWKTHFHREYSKDQVLKVGIILSNFKPCTKTTPGMLCFYPYLRCISIIAWQWHELPSPVQVHNAQTKTTSIQQSPKSRQEIVSTLYSKWELDNSIHQCATVCMLILFLASLQYCIDSKNRLPGFPGLH